MSTKSITLQTNDTVVTSGEQLGLLSFAASNESDGSSALLIAAQIYAQAEGAFTSSQNPTSLVLATSAADALAASPKIKITDSGHLLPFVDDVFDLGDTNLKFRTGYFSDGVVLEEATPGVTTDKLYQNGGALFFDGSAVGGGAGDPGTSGIINVDSFYTIDPDGSGTISELTIDRALKSSIYETTNPGAATVNLDFDLTNMQSFTISGDATVTFSGVDVGQRIFTRITQNSVAGHAITWPTNIRWPGQFEPTLSQASGQLDVFGFTCTASGADWNDRDYDGYVVGYNLASG